MRLVGVVGPTASGKTSLAVALARRMDGEIVGVDASQIYRGMDIGTGKATPAELCGVRHHLLSVVGPDEVFDAARYVRLADPVINQIIAARKRPVLCGGTGLYLRALLHGLCEAPPVSQRVRATLQSRIAVGEVAQLHAELAEVDPTSSERINPNDRQRIERALGVFLTTGNTLSEWQQQHQFKDQRYDAILVGIEWSREDLNQRIAARIDSMLASGWVEEVAELLRDGLSPGLASMKALGYSHIAEHLAGRLSLDEAREKTFIATRRYAKRQMTWFRSMKGIHWFDGGTTADTIVSFVERRIEEEL